MKIIFSGGGTLGPVVPLLAVAEAYKKQYKDADFLWIGTKNGPERQLIEENGIKFISIGAGKWRRYFSLLNFFDLFKMIYAFFQSIYILWKERPQLLVSAGGYVSVPLHYAATFLALPQWVHQQDVQIGFANKLMFPFATKVTTALSETAQQLSKYKAEWIGNPSRDLSVRDVAESKKRFGIPGDAPVIFALGGGTGSTSINQIVLTAVPQLDSKCHVIHLTGKDRQAELSEKAAAVFPNYHVYTFFTEEMKDAYAACDIVVARAGFSTLTELAQLKKPAIIMPMFDTHQEDNARMFAAKGGILLLDKGMNNGLKLAQIIKDLLQNQKLRTDLGERLHAILPRTKPEMIVGIIDHLVSNVK